MPVVRAAPGGPTAAPRGQDYRRAWLFSDDILIGTVTGSQEQKITQDIITNAMNMFMK